MNKVILKKKRSLFFFATGNFGDHSIDLLFCLLKLQYSEWSWKLNNSPIFGVYAFTLCASYKAYTTWDIEKAYHWTLDCGRCYDDNCYWVFEIQNILKLFFLFLFGWRGGFNENSINLWCNLNLSKSIPKNKV